MNWGNSPARWPALVMLVGFLAGCHATHYDYIPPQLPIFSAEEVTASKPAPLDKSTSTPLVMSLPQAIEMAVLGNLRIQADREKIAQARADFITESLIPNSELFTDAQLIPLQRVNLENQAGPPQFDAMLTIPVDWWLFGKRVAAMEAARVGVDVVNAEVSNKIRLIVAETVQEFYSLLEAQDLLELAQASQQNLEKTASITARQVEAGEVSKSDLDRVRLEVLDAQRETQLRQQAIQLTKAKLRPLIGKTALDDDFSIQGTLKTNKLALAPTLSEAVALAEKHRPDLLSNRYAIDQARASIEREHRKARPVVSVSPALNYQLQQSITGFRDATLFSVGVTTTLPCTNLNQGGVARANSELRQSQLELQSNVASVRSEVESALLNYESAKKFLESEAMDAVEIARGIKVKTEDAFKAGGRGMVDVLLADRVLRARQQAVVNARANYWRALHQLNAVVGLRAFGNKQE